MHRSLILSLIALSLAAVVFAAPTVVVNGNVSTVSAIEANGKIYVDPVALMQLLGGKATYDAATHKVMINSTAPAGGGGAAANPANWGTAQMPGDSGAIGQVYSIRKDEPLYFRLNSAEFTTEQVVIGEAMRAPKADEKLLVLHFSVQNPAKDERLLRWDSLKFTVVDAMNVNHETDADWGDEQSHQRVEIQLKPAQRLDLFTVFTVPAQGAIPKLIVQPPTDNDGPVLRYDLRDIVKGLQPPVADPADASGATALQLVPAPFNAPCPLQDYTVTLEKTEYVTTALGDDTPDEGERFLTAALRIKRASPADGVLRGDSLQPVLAGEDGVELRYRDMIGATGAQAVDQDIKSGQELRVRLYFTVPKDATPKTLTLKEGESRAYQFAIPK